MSTPSTERIKYLKAIKREKILVIFFRVIIILIFLLGWELLGKLGIINTFLSSSPTNILKTTIKLIKDNTLFKHIAITLYEIIVSFIISFLISVLVAVIMWLKPIISKILDPYLSVLNSLPKVALGPLIIIWTGAGTKSIILMGLLISVFVTTINIYNYFSTTDYKYILLMKSFGAKKMDILKKVIIPSNYNNIISALKVNLSMNFIGVIMGELLVSKKGLGYLITYASSVFHIDLVITSVFILCLLSYLMYFAVELFSKKISK